MNPIEFLPSEVCEEILFFLKGTDLLTASTVSTAWYDAIAASPKCLKKILVKTNCDQNLESTREIVPLIAFSARKYSNLEIRRCSKCIHNIQPLFYGKQHNWLQVSFINTTFVCIQQILYYFEGFEKTVEELTLTDVFLDDRSIYQKTQKLTFPKLTKLRLTNVHVSIFHEAFENIRTLVKLEIFSDGQTPRSSNALTEILKKNLKLRILILKSSVFNHLMYSDFIKDLKFQLFWLEVHCLPSNFSQIVQKNLTKLLIQQKDNLKRLVLGDWYGIDVLKAAYQISNLRVLELKGLTIFHSNDSVKWEDVNLFRNTSIVLLKLKDAPPCMPMLEKLTSAAPKLINFVVAGINSEFMDHINQTLKNLVGLSIGTFSPDDVSNPEIFKSLKELSFRSIKRNIYDTIWVKSEKDRSHFESLIYENVNRCFKTLSREKQIK